MKIKGQININVMKGKEIVKTYKFDNLITSLGINHILKLIGGDVTGGVNRMALGSGSTAPTLNDKKLNNTVALVNINSRDYSEANKVFFQVIIPENTFTEVKSFIEAGLVYKSQTEEILISRVVFKETVYQYPDNSLSISYMLELENRGV